ncbi:hypothetical protein OHV13_33265 [Kitasatospora purpeofusca]|uniref:helix-turn-helix transcriptional regulator n=1 Tax=Kitasatospora purpeofusca TaxID=67352 RepID=UPI0032479E63
MTNLEIHAADKPPARRSLGRACPHCDERLAVTWEGQQALTLVARGTSARAIARQLGLGTSASPDATAAEVLLSRTLNHLGAATRAQGIDIAYRAMLLPAPARPRYLTRALTDDEVQVVRHLLLGYSSVETARLLGITLARVNYALLRLSDDLDVPEGAGRTAMTVYRMHGARLLPDVHPCRCRSTVPALAAALWAQGTPCPHCRVRPVLTLGEHTVLGMLGAGMSDQEIGAWFATTKNGGTKRVQKTLAALGAATRVQAVHIGCCTGLIVPRKDQRPFAAPVGDAELDDMLGLTQGFTLSALVERGAGASHRELKARTRRLYARIGADSATSAPGRAVVVLHSLDVLPRTHPCRCTTPAAPTTEPATDSSWYRAWPDLLHA